MQDWEPAYRRPCGLAELLYERCTRTRGRGDSDDAGEDSDCGAGWAAKPKPARLGLRLVRASRALGGRPFWRAKAGAARAFPGRAVNIHYCAVPPARVEEGDADQYFTAARGQIYKPWPFYHAFGETCRPHLMTSKDLLRF